MSPCTELKPAQIKAKQALKTFHYHGLHLALPKASCVMFPIDDRPLDASLLRHRHNQLGGRCDKRSFVDAHSPVKIGPRYLLGDTCVVVSFPTRVIGESLAYSSNRNCRKSLRRLCNFWRRCTSSCNMPRLRGLCFVVPKDPKRGRVHMTSALRGREGVG